MPIETVDGQVVISTGDLVVGWNIPLLVLWIKLRTDDAMPPDWMLSNDELLREINTLPVVMKLHHRRSVQSLATILQTFLDYGEFDDDGKDGEDSGTASGRPGVPDGPLGGD